MKLVVLWVLGMNICFILSYKIIYTTWLTHMIHIKAWSMYVHSISFIFKEMGLDWERRELGIYCLNAPYISLNFIKLKYYFWNFLRIKYFNYDVINYSTKTWIQSKNFFYVVAFFLLNVLINCVKYNICLYRNRTLINTYDVRWSNLHVIVNWIC